MEDDGQAIVIWHDYGSFALYRIREDAWDKLSQQTRSQVELADEMDRLILQGRNIDQLPPDAGQLNFITNDEGQSLHLIQFVGPIKDEWLRKVKATGAELAHYVANNGYIIWAGEKERRQLQTFVAEGEFLQKSLPYLPSFKIEPSLEKQVRSSNTVEGELITVIVQMYSHPGVAKNESLITSLLVDTISPWTPILNFQNTTGKIRKDDIATIAQLPDVMWVGEYHPPELTDEVQGRIVAGSLNSSGTAPNGPGYLTWFSLLGFSTNPNDYPIVDITDTGTGNGLAREAGGDTTMRELGDPNLSSRIEYIANCTTGPTGGDPDGHGSINMSIAGGYDQRSGTPYRDTEGFQRGLGVNPYGRFAGTRVFLDEQFNLSACGSSEQSLIRQSFNRGARIVSNSWGCSGCSGSYTATSQIYDAGVRDADHMSPGNQELFILFSAGNGGPAEKTIGAPGNGKNIMTVGASENVRPTWTDGCNIGPAQADNVQDIFNLSSRGPAPGGRVKPDVVAPGTHIQGTASAHPDYNGKGVCDVYHPGGQLVFAASTGTSHAVPAVAGMASLAHAYIRQQEGLSDPSPALLKGFIIAHTSYLMGDGAGGDLPSNNQGYGLPDMTAAFDDTSRVLIDQNQAPIFSESGETWTRVFSVADPDRPVRIVLSYTDQPGAIGTEPQVNDLNLKVQIQDETYLGNHMSGQWSVTGGTADKVNNVEAVFLPSVNDTVLEVEITAFNIAGDGVPGAGDETDQDFTLVCSNCIVQEDFTLSAEPMSNNICVLGTVDYTLAIASINNFAEPVALAIQDFPQGINANFDPNPVNPPSESLLTFIAGQNSTPGSFNITIRGQSTTRQHALPIQLNVYSISPQSPTPLQPSSGAKNLPVDVTLTWSATDQAATYDLQIATDSRFEEIVESGSGLTDTSYIPSSLKPGVVYYWHVRASNGCGTSYFSLTSSFTTKSLPGSCPAGVEPNILYQTDFEGPLTGWSSSGARDTWALSTVRSLSPGTSYYAQNVGEVSDQMLESPAISLPPLDGPIYLQFWNYQWLESNFLKEEVCFDGAILEISTNDGGSWQQLGDAPGDNSILITDPYDGYIDPDQENPLAGKTAWCGDPQDWMNSVVLLDDYAEQTVRFRFRLGTDRSVSHEGWYIDDVLVQACPITMTELYIPLSMASKVMP
ncbi:MAG: S8 family serine peptidase [Candidatus Promineifilaceae bacterium]|nr:S8 family serine peptidase [Candidatus Promineifilaceae bacterium]